MRQDLVLPRPIRYVLTVAEHQSFTRAAKALHVSQPTLSQQVKKLEDALGVQLLDRSGRAVRLTDAGEIYLHHARRALHELDAGKRAVKELNDLSYGYLRVGMTPITQHLTTSLLDLYRSRYPGIVVAAVEIPLDVIEAGVGEGKFDVGIALASAPTARGHASNVETQDLFTEPLTLAVGAVHPLARRQVPLTIEELRQQALVLLNPDFALRRQFDRYCVENSVAPLIAIETNSLSMILQTIALGHLMTVLPSMIASAYTGIESVPLSPELPNFKIALIASKNAYKSPACRAFEKVAEEWCLRSCQLVPTQQIWSDIFQQAKEPLRLSDESAAPVAVEQSLLSPTEPCYENAEPQLSPMNRRRSTMPSPRERLFRQGEPGAPPQPALRQLPHPERIGDELFGSLVRTSHDIGGEPDISLQFQEKEEEQWELNTYVTCECLAWRGVWNAHERRRGQNVNFGQTQYLRLPYYGRWLLSAARVMVDKGEITLSELINKIDEVQKRYDNRRVRNHPE